ICRCVWRKRCKLWVARRYFTINPRFWQRCLDISPSGRYNKDSVYYDPFYIDASQEMESYIMAKDKKQVEAITSRDVDFAQWFTDVCTKAELIDYSSIKGVFIYRPYGYAIWENIQRVLDDEFK